MADDKPAGTSKSDFLRFLRTIGPDGWATYTALMLHSREGVCNAEQQDLMDALGVSKTALNTRLRKLRLAGAIVSNDGTYQLRLGLPIEYGIAVNTLINNTYLTSKIVSSVPSVSSAKNANNASNVWNVTSALRYWCEAYEKAYGTPYESTTWARETQSAKALLRRYDEATYKALVDVVMRLYTTKWASGGFRRPTLGQLSSWLAQQALAYVQANSDAKASQPQETEIDASQWI